MPKKDALKDAANALRIIARVEKKIAQVKVLLKKTAKKGTR